MDKTHKNDDELLSAFIDGELSTDDAAALAERLAREPGLAQRLEAMRSGDEAVRALYAQLDQAPLPDGVMRLLDTAGGEVEESRVVPFPLRAMRRLANQPFAIAAGVAVVAGFLAVLQLQNRMPTSPVEALVAGQLEAGSEVYEFLEHGVSGRPEVIGESTSMQVILSFESGSGDYCRQLYVAAPGQAVHGVACKGIDGWQLEAVAAAAPDAPDGAFQTAVSDIPEAVSSAVDGLIGAREPLSEDEENTLISEGWKKPSN